MTFEEFFKKKRIDLDAFRLGNPTLLSEFKMHFEQMGEKSFDHTKKYWFNKLRGEYHLAPDVKAEKPKIENQLAEQTVVDAIHDAADPAVNAPKTAFTPRFKAAVGEPVTPPKPEEQKTDDTPPATTPKPGFTPRFKAGATKPADTAAPDKAEDASAPLAPPKPGFTPRFKAGVTKPTEATTTPSAENEGMPASAEAENPKGFTPRFKAGVTKPAEPASEKNVDATPETSSVDVPAEKPKGFTLRFKAGVSKPAEPASEEKLDVPAVEPSVVASTPEAEKPKGFTPRFKAGVTKGAGTSTDGIKEEPIPEVATAGTQKTPSADAAPEENKEAASEAAKPKIGFTPRFKAGVTKQTPPPTEE